MAHAHQMEAPIRMKVNGHWFDVYVKTGDRDTEEHIKGEEVDTMLTVNYSFKRKRNWISL